MGWNIFAGIFLGLATACYSPSETRTKGGRSVDETSAIFGDYSSASHYYLRSGDGLANSSHHDPNSGQIPDEISHCTWSLNGTDGYASGSGHFSQGELDQNQKNLNLCQHKGDELKVYLQLKYIPTEGVCLIPTFRNEQDGKQTSIGNFRCQRMASDNTKAQLFELVKDRVGFTQFPINGVMLMKDKKYTFPPPYPKHPISNLAAYNHCMQQLVQKRNHLFCVAFKRAGHYHYHQF